MIGLQGRSQLKVLGAWGGNHAVATGDENPFAYERATRGEVDIRHNWPIFTRIIALYLETDGDQVKRPLPHEHHDAIDV